MQKTDEYRLSRIKELCKELLQYIDEKQIDLTTLTVNKELQWTLTTPLYNIGEQVYCLTSSYKAEHSQIPWNSISGLRHRLVHDYEETNWDYIADSIRIDISKLLEFFRLLRLIRIA